MSVKLTTCGQVTRVFFLIINILFLLLGIGLIAGGSYLVATGNNLAIVTGNSAVGGAALIIIAGIVTVLITACGIIGAIFLLRVLLGVYLVVVVIVIILELVAGILGIVFREKLESGTTDFVRKAIEKYNKNDTSAIKAIDLLQTSFQCCGWNSSADWVNRTEGVPDSCDCDTGPPKCGADGIWMSGCKDGVLSAVRTYAIAIGVVGILFAFLEVIAVLLALGLCVCVTRGKNDYTTV